MDTVIYINTQHISQTFEIHATTHRASHRTKLFIHKHHQANAISCTIINNYLGLHEGI